MIYSYSKLNVLDQYKENRINAFKLLEKIEKYALTLKHAYFKEPLYPVALGKN